MKRWIMRIIPFLLLAAGALVFLYPRISARVSRINQSKVIERYCENAEDISDAIYGQELTEAKKYNRRLQKHPDFNSAVTAVRKDQSGQYEKLLNMAGDGVMGYISIPKVDIYLPIYHGTDEDQLTLGVGHQEGSSLPVGGAGTHTVLTGHRGLPSSELFTKLDEVAEGDLFFLHTLGEKRAYTVDQIITVMPEETQELSVVSGKDYATLVTCTPYGINTHRLLIRGERTEINPKEEVIQEKSDWEKERRQNMIWIAGWIGLAVLLLIALLVRGKKGGRR